MNIEADIPIPKKCNGKVFPSTLAMRQMQAGQSILIAGEIYHSIAVRAEREFGSGNYAMRTVEGGIRLWRKS